MSSTALTLLRDATDFPHLVFLLPDELPYLRCPLHTIFKLTPVAYGNYELRSWAGGGIEEGRDFKILPEVCLEVQLPHPCTPGTFLSASHFQMYVCICVYMYVCIHVCVYICMYALGIHTFFDGLLFHNETKAFSLDFFSCPQEKAKKKNLFSVFSGCKVETVKLNVEAVNTHRDKPTVSVFPEVGCRCLASLSLEP